FLVRMDRETVRQFVTKYQDRILYATDFSLGQGDEARAAKSLLSVHDREWNYFSGAGENALSLQDSILRKIFRENAVRWIPGLAPALWGRMESCGPIASALRACAPHPR